jgi:PBP1b-binding outer membrane lipoprotein LpoB
MKPLLTAAVALFLAGCAADTPPAQEVHDQFQADFPDRSQLAPLNPLETPNIAPSVEGPNPH